MIRAAAFAFALAAGTLGLALLPASAEAAEPSPAISSEASPEAPVVTSLTPEEAMAADELAELTEREAASPELQTFEGGGDGVYISSGVVLLVLVIVIIIIIL